MSTIKKLIFLVLALIFMGGAVFPFVSKAFADQEKPMLNPIESKELDKVLMVQGNTLAANTEHYYNEPSKRIWVIVTGYSSDPLETDDTPFITASGSFVREGIVAANFLPFGTKIRIPVLFGDEVFVVEDRMNPRKRHQIDVWFPSKQEAINSGAHRTYIELVE